MTEVSLKEQLYTGVFNGAKGEVSGTRMVSSEVGNHPESYHNEWYEGAGLIQYKPNNKKYFFRFLIPQKFSKSSLKESLESLCDSSGGFDIFCQSLISLMERSKEQIPRISLQEDPKY